MAQRWRHCSGIDHQVTAMNDHKAFLMTRCNGLCVHDQKREANVLRMKGKIMTTMSTIEHEPVLPRLSDPLPRMFDWFEALVPGDFSWRNGYAHTMRVEEFIRNDEFVVRAELPGIDPDQDVEISITNGMLTIEGRREEKHEEKHRSEFFYGRFMRTLTLPSGVDTNLIRAEYKDGILEVTVPMARGQEKAQRIQVTRGE